MFRFFRYTVIKFPSGGKNLRLSIDYDIIEKGNNAFNANNDYKESFLKNFFGELKDFLFSSFLNALNRGSALIKYNEKIYDYYKMVIGYYKSAVKVYSLKRNNILSEEVKEIADGIIDILECQINKFDEVTEKTEKQSNPIIKEKEKIIDENFKLFSKDIILIYEKMSREFNNFNIENYFENIYKLYFFSVKNCFIRLNDIASRKMANIYYEALKQEMEALSVIIKVQANVLERKLRYTEEELIVQSVLMNLREGYQHLSKQIDEMEKGFKETVVYERFIEKYDEDFKNKILFCLKRAERKSENFKKRFEYCNSDFISMLKEYSEEIRDIERIKTDINEISFFGEKIISKFQFLYDDWKINADNYSKTSFYDIISGISETVDIKIQNIQENVFEFLQKADVLISEISKNEKYDRIFMLFEKYDGNLDETVNEIFFEINMLIDKYGNVCKKTRKLILELQKDCILFEISTFEEIMNYSVSRMRNSQNLYIEAFVQNIDFVFGELKQVLSVVGVEIIAPKPHDIFNGKEHEVIMAEKNNDFKKGEIIKLVNSGYKNKNYVILRANVIAAK